MATTPDLELIAVGCDGGHLYIFNMQSLELEGMIETQKNDIVSMIFVNNSQLVVGQGAGFIDVLQIDHEQVLVTHALQIKEARDFNGLSLATGHNNLMIACAKGLL